MKGILSTGSENGLKLMLPLLKKTNQFNTCKVRAKGLGCSSVQWRDRTKEPHVYLALHFSENRLFQATPTASTILHRGQGGNRTIFCCPILHAGQGFLRSLAVVCLPEVQCSWELPHRWTNTVLPPPTSLGLMTQWSPKCLPCRP